MNKNLPIKILLLYFIVLQFFSCKTLYGIKPQTEISHEKINQFYNYLALKNYEKGILDSNHFKNIKEYFRDDSVYRYYHLQPIQALYYNKQGKFISYHVNCNAGGFPNLNWNRNSVFNGFPAVTQTKPSNKIDLSTFKKLTGTQKDTTNENFTVVVLWNFLLEKQSKSLIHLINKNITQADEPVNFILLNNDNWYMENKN